MTANTILVVERDILVRHPLAQYLRDCGYDVIEAVDVEDARQAFSKDATHIKVALIDMHSPTEDGFALSSWIRARFPSIHVIMAGTVTKAMQSAGDLCDDGPSTRKPADYRPILDRIRRLLATREAESEADESDT